MRIPDNIQLSEKIICTQEDIINLHEFNLKIINNLSNLSDMIQLHVSHDHQELIENYLKKDQLNLKIFDIFKIIQSKKNLVYFLQRSDIFFEILTGPGNYINYKPIRYGKNFVLPETCFQIYKNKRISVVEGSIIYENTDCIVNSNEPYLLWVEDGVSAAIFKEAGKKLIEECIEWVKQNNEVQLLSNAFTKAGNLPCKYIIHTVSPMWTHKSCDYNKLYNCQINVFHTAEKLQCKSISLVTLSSGNKLFPTEICAEVTIDTIIRLIDQKLMYPDHIRLIDLDPRKVQEFCKKLKQKFE